MCGICGIVGCEYSDVAEGLLRRMMRRIEHRGPDEEGILIRRGAGLGMRRLSIIDIGGGSQPVFNEDGTVAVVFNGEIYNFRELRAALESRGHHFRTQSDTEVIVHAYEEWGERCLEHLRGMFAFAVWDEREKAQGDGTSSGRVFLARDRLGIKPLYYAFAKGVLLFASEVRALLASERIPRRVARDSLDAYLLFGSVVEPLTMVEGVFSLPPGHFMSVPCRVPLAAKPVNYWNLADAALEVARHAPRNLASAKKAVRPLLEQAVHSHLLADVSLGIFLSSGLDSTALAVIAARERSDLHTFTVAFTESEFNEAGVARETAVQLGAQHTEFVVTPEEMVNRLPEAVAAFDQPSMDGVNTFFVSWAARQVGLKVALSGLGGDEVFGGYSTFRNTPRIAKLAMLARAVPARLRNRIAEILLGTDRHDQAQKRSDLVSKGVSVWRDPELVPHPYFFTRMLFTHWQVDRLRYSSSGSARRNRDSTSPWAMWLADAVEQSGKLRGDSVVSCLELSSYTPDTLLRDTDAMSMHHSLEVRVPWLDHPLVEFVVGLSDAAKHGEYGPKALLAAAVSDLLPESVRRQPKRTFTFPWEHWLRGPLGQQVARQLNDLSPSLAPLLDARAVGGVWRSFLEGHTSWSRPWSLYVLNEWVRRNVDEIEPPPAIERAHSASMEAATRGKVRDEGRQER